MAEDLSPEKAELLDMSNLDDIDEKDLAKLAQAAEAGERYEDMCKFMMQIIHKSCKKGQGCATDQRNMLSVAFKNVVGAKRQSMRNLKEETAAARETEDAKLTAIRLKYLKMVENEVIAVCNQVLNVVYKGPLANKEDNDDEGVVFWQKMCGDYCRYLSEIGDNDDAKVDIEDFEESSPALCAEKFYKQAMISAEKLPETHPTRLGLALNYSVCFYEILGKKEEACTLAKEAFDNAIEKLDTLNDKSYKDSTLIMQLLRDNLTLWTQTNTDKVEAAPTRQDN